MLSFLYMNVDRNPQLMQDEFFVYDISRAELEQFTLCEQAGKMILAKDEQINKFNVICKRDLFNILVLFSCEDLKRTTHIFGRCKEVDLHLDKYIPMLNKSNSVAIYKAIMDSIKINSNWSMTHIAAKIGLDTFFSETNIVTAEVNKQIEPDLMTPLHVAIQAEKINCVKALLKYPVDHNLITSDGLTTLHLAAISSKDILSKIIVLPGMFERYRLKTSKGCTPLHLACYSNKLQNVNLFLKRGMTISMLSVVPPDDGKHSYQAKTPNDDIFIQFCDDEISEFEQDFVPCGGTPLHWTRRQSLMEKLVEDGFDVDAVNLEGDTALIVKIKRQRFNCLVSLLCNNADPNIVNKRYNTALNYSIKLGDVTITQALTVFDADINYKNRKGQSIRHLAATEKNEASFRMMLYVLSSIDAERCPPEMEGCNDGCSHDGTYGGKRYSKWPDFESDELFKSFMMDKIISNYHENLKTKDTSKLVNMVGFDGGGVKGLITIQMVHELQKKLKHNFIDYFTWMSGTSTGSIIIASFLSGKSTHDIRSLYFRFKDRVMAGCRPYSSISIEELLQKELGKNVKLCDMFRVKKKFAMIPATLIDRVPVQLHLFRSYPLHELCPWALKCHQQIQGLQPIEDYAEQLLWRAVRASSAAPTYFSASGQFVDGGILANNPTLDMMADFNRYNNGLKRENKFDEVQNLNLVLSFGTGLIQPKRFLLPELKNFISWNVREMATNMEYVKHMFNIILDAACNSDFHIVDRIEAWCVSSSVPFFRINPKLIEMLNMDETNNMEIINYLWLAKVFMHSKKELIDKLVSILEASYSEPDNDLNVDLKKKSNLKLNQTSIVKSTIDSKQKISRKCSSEFLYKSCPKISSKSSTKLSCKSSEYLACNSSPIYKSNAKLSNKSNQKLAFKSNSKVPVKSNIKLPKKSSTKLAFKSSTRLSSNNFNTKVPFKSNMKLSSKSSNKLSYKSNCKAVCQANSTTSKECEVKQYSVNKVCNKNSQTSSDCSFYSAKSYEFSPKSKDNVN